jgi:Protein of unknown function (DUF3800)
MAKDLYRVYVDETGDRGWGGRASPIFVASAVIVENGEVKQLTDALDAINSTLGKPLGTVLHWAENVKEHSQRKVVARELATTPAVITNAVVMKQPLMGSGSGLSSATTMYNYVVRRLLERITWYLRDRGAEGIITFAHVRRFPYQRLNSYLQLLRSQPTEIRWSTIRSGKVRIDQPNRVRGLQVADLTAGAVGSALRPDRYGDFEPSYLQTILPRLYIRRGGSVTSYGMNIIGPQGCMQAAYPWWPDFLRACQQRPERQ